MTRDLEPPTAPSPGSSTVKCAKGAVCVDVFGFDGPTELPEDARAANAVAETREEPASPRQGSSRLLAEETDGSGWRPA